MNKYDDILPIEEMPSLAKRIGKSGVERVRYHRIADTTPQKGATNIQNTVINQMQHYQPNTLGCPVGEFIEVAATFDINQSRPLNINRLYNILQCMPLINNREIIKMTGLSVSQAGKYLRAVMLILPFLEKHFEECD